MKYPSMHIRSAGVLLVVLCAVDLNAAKNQTHEQIATRQQILDDAQGVADTQLKAIAGKNSIDWTWGVMLAGYAEFSHVAPKGDEYKRAMNTLADQVKWTPLLHPRTPFHADDFCIGQMFLDLYVEHPDPAHLSPLRLRADALVDQLNATRDSKELTFWWCDALFMAPPMLTRLSLITREKKYIDAMDHEFWRTAAAFYDRDEYLFYRDTNYVNKPDKNGKKVFWSRGNGWVLAGLARTLKYMPADYPSRSRYEGMFRDMSAKLITLQSGDGTWPSSLEDPQLFGDSETSGTALFTFAIAWGINNALLDRDLYLPVIEKSWAALLAARRADGLPGYTQSPAASPGPTKVDGTQVYTTGAYLLAATELQKLAPLLLPSGIVLHADPKGKQAP